MGGPWRGERARERGGNKYLAFELYFLFVVVRRVPFCEAGFTSVIGF